MKRTIMTVGLLMLGVASAVAQAPDVTSGGERRRPDGEFRRPQTQPQPQRPTTQPTQPTVRVQPTTRPQPPPPVVRVQPTYRPEPPRVVRERPSYRPPVVFVPAPSYQTWNRSSYPYEARYHDSCQQKAWRLRWFERRASEDGVLTWREQNELRGLRRDLRRTCGDHRWRG
jgi:hypothetical protein